MDDSCAVGSRCVTLFFCSQLRVEPAAASGSHVFPTQRYQHTQLSSGEVGTVQYWPTATFLLFFQPEPPLVRGGGAEPDRGPALIRECPGQRFQAWRLLQDLASSLADADDVLLEPYLQSWDQLLKYKHTEASAAC